MRILIIMIMAWYHSPLYAVCIETPEFSLIHNNSKELSLNKMNEWVSTGIYVEQNKLLKMKWTPKQIYTQLRKYKIIYRIDPRFDKPQIFIQRYNYIDKKYYSDFHQFKDGQLEKYQNTKELTFTKRVSDFVDFFNFTDRPTIPIYSNDVINIRLIEAQKYFSDNDKMNQELDASDSLLLIDTRSSIADNHLIYSNITTWCNEGITTSQSGYSDYCIASGEYSDNWRNWGSFYGVINNSLFNANSSNIRECNANAKDMYNASLCYYTKGRGMGISLSDQVIKTTEQPFVRRSLNDHDHEDFFYYHAQSDGNLQFFTKWKIDEMYNDTFPQFIKDWPAVSNSYFSFLRDTTLNRHNINMNFMHFGRYIMEIEIGNADSLLTQNIIDDIDVEYIIMSNDQGSDALNSDIVGTRINKSIKTNADNSGFLWMRTIRSNNDTKQMKFDGKIEVDISNYSGSTWVSDIIYGKLIKPLRDKYNDLAKLMYHGLINDVALIKIAQMMLTLYVIIYALTYLMGATQISIEDLVIRIVKIAIIVALFSENSWNFFNDYLFTIFINGSDQLINSIINIQSKAGNIFGFIDPIIARYTNPTLWALLIIQLFALFSGLPFFAFITLLSIMMYIRVIVELIGKYCLAFLSLAVMISLAPFFITLILFERTKSLFHNWISVMFNYMLQPTLLLIFFLIIDQMMADYLFNTIIRACIELFPITLHVDLSYIYMPWRFDIPLGGIPYFAPQDVYNNIMQVAASSFIVYILAHTGLQLAQYVSDICDKITNSFISTTKQQPVLNDIDNKTSDLFNSEARIYAAPILASLVYKVSPVIKNRAQKLWQNTKFFKPIKSHASGPLSKKTYAVKGETEVEGNIMPKTKISPSNAAPAGKVSELLDNLKNDKPKQELNDALPPKLSEVVNDPELLKKAIADYDKKNK